MEDAHQDALKAQSSVLHEKEVLWLCIASTNDSSHHLVLPNCIHL